MSKAKIRDIVQRSNFIRWLAKQAPGTRFACLDQRKCPLAVYSGQMVCTAKYGPTLSTRHSKKLPKWAEVFIERWDGPMFPARTARTALQLVQRIK